MIGLAGSIFQCLELFTPIFPNIGTILRQGFGGQETRWGHRVYVENKTPDFRRPLLEQSELLGLVGVLREFHESLFGEVEQRGSVSIFKTRTRAGWADLCAA